MLLSCYIILHKNKNSVDPWTLSRKGNHWLRCVYGLTSWSLGNEVNIFRGSLDNYFTLQRPVSIKAIPGDLKSSDSCYNIWEHYILTFSVTKKDQDFKTVMSDKFHEQPDNKHISLRGKSSRREKTPFSQLWDEFNVNAFISPKGGRKHLPDRTALPKGSTRVDTFHTAEAGG